MMEKSRILVVEDSKFFRNLVSRRVSKRIDAHVVTAETLAETKACVEHADGAFQLALVDIVLPDAQDGEAVDWLLRQKIPCIVFTSVFSEDLRERMLSQNVIDYVVKDTPSSLEYLMALVEQLHHNQGTKVLVVDDSLPARHYMSSLLKSYQFQVVEAADGAEGLAVLKANPDTRMVITDYHMPHVDGVEMVRRIRAEYDLDRLAIIGVSSGGGSALSAKFIKFGANDFINKPFLREEFFCRVMQNIRMLDMVRRLTDASIRDSLTGIHNRRFLFEAGRAVTARAMREAVPLTVAMVDVDHFKDINDTHGHGAGDAVLRRVSGVLCRLCRQGDIVSRFGGEEFVVLAEGMDSEGVVPFFDRLRMAIESETILHDDVGISVTASFGVCHGVGRDLDTMLRHADEAMYRAKGKGRNCVEIA
ncbi:MAG: diguanylate cyclase [Rhodospirillaceae bacterium]|nr:diguanylate cyclase [Rhodospirillaceae bacterium]